MSTGLGRVASKYEKRYSNYFRDVPEVPFTIRDKHGAEHRFGRDASAFTFAAKDDAALSARLLALSQRLAEAGAALSDDIGSRYFAHADGGDQLQQV